MCGVCTMARGPNMRRNIISGVFISSKGEAIISFVDNRISDFRVFYMRLYRMWFLGFWFGNNRSI